MKIMIVRDRVNGQEIRLSTNVRTDIMKALTYDRFINFLEKHKGNDLVAFVKVIDSNTPRCKECGNVIFNNPAVHMHPGLCDACSRKYK